jgi:hypothetical protein
MLSGVMLSFVMQNVVVPLKMEYCYAECRYYCVSFVLSVANKTLMLSVKMLSVIMLSVIMLNVVVPFPQLVSLLLLN